MKSKIRNIVKKMTIVFYRMMVKVLPVQKKVVLFESNLGRNYTGNPRAIYEEFVRHGLDKEYQCIWFFENTNKKIGEYRSVQFDQEKVNSANMENKRKILDEHNKLMNKEIIIKTNKLNIHQ